MKGRSPLRTNYANVSLERLKDALVLLDSQRWTCAIYVAGLAAESMIKSFIVDKDEEIKGHNLARLAEDANFTRRLKADSRITVQAAIEEASTLWRNLYRYSSAADMDRMAKESGLRLVQAERRISYQQFGEQALKVWAERLFELSSTIVQHGELIWESANR